MVGGVIAGRTPCSILSLPRQINFCGQIHVNLWPLFILGHIDDLSLHPLHQQFDLHTIRAKMFESGRCVWAVLYSDTVSRTGTGVWTQQGHQPDLLDHQPLGTLEYIAVLEPPNPRKYLWTEMPPYPIKIDALASQLLLRSQGDNDFGVLLEAGEHGRLTVGRIMRVSRASGRIAWFWTVTGPAEPDANVGLVGEAEDLDAAKVEIRKAFDSLLYWCNMRRDGEIRWHVPAPTQPLTCRQSRQNSFPIQPCSDN
jgi:hypothetical protein